MEDPNFSKCGICFEAFDTHDRVPLTLNCGHNFCKKCVRGYFQKKQEQYIVCSYCRRTTSARPEELGANALLLECINSLRAEVVIESQQGIEELPSSSIPVQMQSSSHSVNEQTPLLQENRNQTQYSATIRNQVSNLRETMASTYTGIVSNLNTRYLRSDQGAHKILQILIGFIISTLLCDNWYGGSSCFTKSVAVLDYTRGLNFLTYLINVVLLFLNLFRFGFSKLEHYYNRIACFLFLLAAICTAFFCLGFLLDIYRPDEVNGGTLFAATVLIIIEFLLFCNVIQRETEYDGTYRSI